MTNTRWLRFLNALMVIVFMGIITAAYYQQEFKHETPCPLCFLQRLAMIGVSLGGLMNLRFGIQIKHYSVSLLSAFFGGIVSLRQVALHICPGFPVFGYPVLGLGLYTWAFISFAAVTFAIIVLLFFYRESQKEPHHFNWFEILAFAAVFLIIAANIVTSLTVCGLSTCKDIPWPQP